MREEILLTPTPVFKDTAATHSQSYTEVMDVLAYSQLDVAVHIYNLEAAASLSATFSIETSMQNKSDDDDLWVSLITYTAITSATPPLLIKGNATTGILRYIRWKLVLAGTTPKAAFSVSGIATRS
jgi:hypothetical protein